MRLSLAPKGHHLPAKSVRRRLKVAMSSCAANTLARAQGGRADSAATAACGWLATPFVAAGFFGKPVSRHRSTRCWMVFCCALATQLGTITRYATLNTKTHVRGHVPTHVGPSHSPRKPKKTDLTPRSAPCQTLLHVFFGFSTFSCALPGLATVSDGIAEELLAHNASMVAAVSVNLPETKQRTPIGVPFSSSEKEDRVPFP